MKNFFLIANPNLPWHNLKPFILILSLAACLTRTSCQAVVWRSWTQQEWLLVMLFSQKCIKPCCRPSSGDSFWRGWSTGAGLSPPVQRAHLAKSAVLACSDIATDTAYQHNVGLTVSATGVAKDPNFLDIKASFRQRQFEPNHSSWDSNVFSIGVVFMLTVPEGHKKPVSPQQIALWAETTSVCC